MLAELPVGLIFVQIFRLNLEVGNVERYKCNIFQDVERNMRKYLR